jgi:hypothetical protein
MHGFQQFCAQLTKIRIVIQNKYLMDLCHGREIVPFFIATSSDLGEKKPYLTHLQFTSNSAAKSRI